LIFRQPTNLGCALIVASHEQRNASVAKTNKGDIITISSFGQLTQKQQKAVADAMGVEITRDIRKVEEFYERNKEKFAREGFGEDGYAPIGHMSDPKDQPGKHHLAHAEKQAAICSGATSLGVSEAVCPKDCLPFFYALAKITGQTYTIADPKGVYVFYPTGIINKLPFDLEGRE
jgi:hypothetical protein